MPEVIPELAYVIGLFFAVVGYLTARGLLATWTHSLGYVLAWLGTHARIRAHVRYLGGFHIDFGGPFRAADHAIITALQVWANGAEIEMGYCLHGMEKVARYTAQAIDFLARETTQTFEWMLHVRLPKWAKWIAAAALPPALIAKLLRAAIAHALPHLVRTYHVVTHEVTHTVSRVVVKTAAVAIPGAHAIPRIERELVGLTRRNLRIAKRLHRVEGLFGVAVLAAAMANVLGLPNWRCLTRGNVGRVARRLCGLSVHALDDLLGLLVDVLILENICNVITIMEDGFGLIQGPLTDFIDTAEAQFVHCNYQLVGSLPDVQLSLPPVTGLVLSLP